MIDQNLELQTDVEALISRFKRIRMFSEEICAPLEIEDYGLQPVVDVSPPKWHLAHSTWFFETFVLIPNNKNYACFDPEFNFLFNSYYNNVGKRVLRHERGFVSRPKVERVYAYRKYVNEAMQVFLSAASPELLAKLSPVIELGLQHEQQHQELLWTDIKYSLGTQATSPAYNEKDPLKRKSIKTEGSYLRSNSGVYEIGFQGEGFSFDNEHGRHEVYLNDFEIADHLVSNREYLAFIEDGGYKDFNLWLDEGWAWVKNNDITAPLYWENIKDQWKTYSLAGLVDLDPNDALCHISFYEASAFAQWKGERLPTEAEWESMQSQFEWGHRWEITSSPYIAYPGFKTAAGAIGEYNGKFMVNQMVWRGASVATSEGHSRATYRNFFHPHLQWQFSGIRLAR